MSEYKLPDAILVDEEPHAQKSQKFEEFGKILAKLKKLSQEPVDLTKRGVYLIAALGMGIVACLMFWVLLFVAFFALLGLFQSPPLNSNLQKAWNFFTKVIKITIGFALAVFSPSDGLGLIAVSGYIQDKARLEDIILKRFLKS